jgi:hypothetical protein
MAKSIFQLRRGEKDDVSGRNDWAAYEKKPDRVKPLKGELVLEYDNGLPRLKIGDGDREFSELPYMSVDSFLFSKVATITLDGGDAWTPVPDFEGRYTQDITEQIKDKITAHSKIDIQPTPEQLYIFHEKDVTFTTVNEEGQVRVCAIGIKPEQTYESIYVTISEVTEDGVIIGNTTATPNPQSDWEQEDSAKADYIKNKDAFIARIASLEAQVESMQKQIEELLNKNS